MNQEGRVTTERQGHVLLIGLDRVARRNAFDKAMLSALALAYGELERDDELRCGVLFAHGDHFTGSHCRG
jgi:enoyl-CoA hydratase